MILPSITSFIPVILIRPNWLNDNAPLEETDNVWILEWKHKNGTLKMLLVNNNTEGRSQSPPDFQVLTRS